MRNSTTDRSPPIVMSSPCTVATICLPLMQPCHTHGHAIPLVNFKSLSVDVSYSSKFCAASRVPYKLYCNNPHMCSSPGNALAAVRQILSFVLERRSTPFARPPVPQPFLHVHSWRSPTALLSAPPAAASTFSTLASRASRIPSRPHLARTLGFPGCPVRLRPSCLDGRPPCPT